MTDHASQPHTAWTGSIRIEMTRIYSTHKRYANISRLGNSFQLQRSWSSLFWSIKNKVSCVSFWLDETITLISIILQTNFKFLLPKYPPSLSKLQYKMNQQHDLSTMMVFSNDRKVWSLKWTWVSVI